MKAAVLVSPGKIVFKERDIKEPGPYEVLLRVVYAGIAGTDLRIYKGVLTPKLPLVLGQEFAGLVEDVGSSVKGFSRGDFAAVEPVVRCGRCEYCLSGRYNLCEKLKVLGVSTDGGFAQKIVLPEYMLHRIPEGVDPKEASLVTPAAVALYALQRAEVSFGDRVAVLGGGAIGLSALQFARAQGAEVVLVEPLKKRRALAKALGIDVLTPEEATESLSGRADVVVEASGNPAAVSSAIEIVKKGGRVSMAGAFGEMGNINLMELVKKDIRISGTWLYPNVFGKVIQALAKKKINLKSYITHEFRFNDIEKAFDKAQSEEALKVLLDFS